MDFPPGSNKDGGEKKERIKKSAGKGLKMFMMGLGLTALGSTQLDAQNKESVPQMDKTPEAKSMTIDAPQQEEMATVDMAQTNKRERPKRLLSFDGEGMPSVNPEAIESSSLEKIDIAIATIEQSIKAAQQNTEINMELGSNQNIKEGAESLVVDASLDDVNNQSSLFLQASNVLEELKEIREKKVASEGSLGVSSIQ